MDQTALLSWGISTLVTLLIGFLVRRQTGKPLLQLPEFVSLSFAVAGLLSGIQIIHQAFTDPVCQSSLGQEGTIVLVLCQASFEGYKGVWGQRPHAGVSPLHPSNKK